MIITNKRWIPGNIQTKLTSLGDIPGVVTTGLTAGHSLIYDGTNWNAKAAVQASINSINDIPGVTIGNTTNNQALANGQSLVYNDVSGGWVNGQGVGGGGKMHQVFPLIINYLIIQKTVIYIMIQVEMLFMDI